MNKIILQKDTNCPICGNEAIFFGDMYRIEDGLKIRNVFYFCNRHVPFYTPEIIRKEVVPYGSNND